MKADLTSVLSSFIGLYRLTGNSSLYSPSSSVSIETSYVMKDHIIGCGSNQVLKSLPPASCNLHCLLPPPLCQHRHLFRVDFIFHVGPHKC